MEKKVLIALIVVIVIIVLVLVGAGAARYYFYIKEALNEEVNTNTAGVPAVPVNYSNIESALVKNSVVKALPEKSLILLRFYNFNSGEREIEKSFSITKDKIKEEVSPVLSDYDIILSLHSKYLAKMTTGNFCSIIQEANDKGDLGFESSLSSAKLAWKFKSVLKHKSCFGL